MSALTFWHQGVMLTAEFPSFALVALSGCIEAIADSPAFAKTEIPPKEPCKTCGNIPRASNRFWDTVALVAGDEEVELLRRQWNVYGRRSQVAHGRTTQGIETAFGSIFLLRYDPPTSERHASLAIDETDPAQVFMLQVLPTVRGIATRLLCKVLRADGL
jgi:hypothetical protein